MAYDLKKISYYQPLLRPETPTSFAVLIPIIYYPNKESEIILMQRPLHFSSYAGDICFPGGKREVTDQSLQQTALRETAEEIGMNIDEPLIPLNDFHDRYQQLVRPFVKCITEEEFLMQSLTLSEEVHQIYFLPLSELERFIIDIENFKPTLRRPNYIYRYNNMVIWGLTAAILVHLRNIISS